MSTIIEKQTNKELGRKDPLKEEEKAGHTDLKSGMRGIMDHREEDFEK